MQYITLQAILTSVTNCVMEVSWIIASRINIYEKLCNKGVLAQHILLIMLLHGCSPI